MKRSINRLRVSVNWSGTMREQLRVAIIGAARGIVQGIYLPYICHVPNCITRYVGFLYKMALRSHRLCCHRSIWHAPLFSDLSPSLFPFFSLSLSRTHTRVLRLALSPYGSRPCRSFIIHTVLKVQRLLANAWTVRRKTPFYTVGEFWQINREVERSISPVRAVPKRWHVLMLESASEVNAASEKRERER